MPAGRPEAYSIRSGFDKKKRKAMISKVKKGLKAAFPSDDAPPKKEKKK